MAIRKLEMKNVTVFDEISLDFSSGINVFVGSNGVGKTHVMKMLYSACQAVRHDVSFPHKVVRTFRPDGAALARLINRNRTLAERNASVKVVSDVSEIVMRFSSSLKKWDAEVIKEEQWEKKNAGLESVFIPAKEILSHACNLTEAVSKGNVEFDDTYVDVIASAKVNITKTEMPPERSRSLDALRKICGGKVEIDDERFYLKTGNRKLEFSLVAEGLRKIALLWQLIQNGALEKGSILFWDEPEANLNPEHIPMIADLLLLLQREGVQVFVSTHDYFLAKYLDGRAEDTDDIAFFSFYKEKQAVLHEKKRSFRDLVHNPIMDTFMALYHEEVRRRME